MPRFWREGLGRVDNRGAFTALCSGDAQLESDSTHGAFELVNIVDDSSAPVGLRSKRKRVFVITPSVTTEKAPAMPVDPPPRVLKRGRLFTGWAEILKCIKFMAANGISKTKTESHFAPEVIRFVKSAFESMTPAEFNTFGRLMEKVARSKPLGAPVPSSPEFEELLEMIQPHQELSDRWDVLADVVFKFVQVS